MQRTDRTAGIVLSVILGVACLFGALRDAAAAPIATLPARLSNNEPHEFGGPLLQSSIEFAMWVGPNGSDIKEGSLLFRFTITEADLGKTLVASALNFPEFADAVARLTNASLNDFVSAMAEFPGGGGGGAGAAEADVPINLSGKTIGKVLVVIDLIQFDTPGQDPNNDGLWTDTRFNATIIFDSEAPEVASVPAPASLALLGLGLVATGWLRRKGTAL